MIRCKVHTAPLEHARHPIGLDEALRALLEEVHGLFACRLLSGLSWVPRIRIGRRGGIIAATCCITSGIAIKNVGPLQNSREFLIWVGVLVI